MRNRLPVIRMLIFIPFFVSCASSYKPIHPDTLPYYGTTTNDNIDFSYHYDVLTETHNKKYAKHEMNKQLSLVAVKITNHTGHDLNPSTDAVFYLEDVAVHLVDDSSAVKEMKQGVAIYLLYMLLTPTTINSGTTNSNGTSNTSSFPVGLILGPAITGVNMITAGSANGKFRDEMENYSLNRQVRNGETIYALVAFQNIGKGHMTLRLK